MKKAACSRLSKRCGILLKISGIIYEKSLEGFGISYSITFHGLGGINGKGL